MLQNEETLAIESSAVADETGFVADVREEGDEGGGHAVAVLVAIAAIVAAILGANAAILASDSSDSWQSAVRQEVKRDAALVEDVRFVFGDEGRNAFRVAQARVRADAYRTAAATATDPVKTALTTEAAALDQVAGALEGSADLVSNPAYGLPDGGFDMAKRLTDIRNEHPDLIATNPDAAQAAGDASATKSTRMLAAAIVVAFALFFGAVAEVFSRQRRWLLTLGVIALVVGSAAGIAVEIGAVA